MTSHVEPVSDVPMTCDRLTAGIRGRDCKPPGPVRAMERLVGIEERRTYQGGSEGGTQSEGTERGIVNTGDSPEASLPIKPSRCSCLWRRLSSANSIYICVCVCVC